MASLFENCSVSQFIFTITALSFFLGGSNQPGELSYDALALNRVYHGEVQRLFLSQLFFNSIPQTFVGLVLIFSFRQFERQMGSRKFGAFVAISFLIALAFQLVLIMLASLLGISSNLVPSPGPFYVVFATLPLFYRHIPKMMVFQYSVMGIRMILSEKSWFYLLAVQLLLSDGIASVIPGLSGLLAGYLYTFDRLRLNAIRLPRAVEGFLNGIGGFVNSLVPLGAVPQEQRPNRNRNAPADFNLNDILNNQGIGRGAGGAFAAGDNANWGEQAFGPLFDRRRAPSQPPSEESIASLTGLGFERAAALRALEDADNNVEAAANRLLGAM